MAAGTALVVRTAHVAAMAVLLGGTTAVWGVLRVRAAPEATAREAAVPDASGATTAAAGTGGNLPDGAAATTALLARFEWAFWAAVGVLVVTGVGNLGAVGAPGPSTPWGTTLTVKLAVVVAFVLGSFVRTLAVLRLRESAQSAAVGEPDGLSPNCSPGRLRLAYAATGWTLLLLVALAEVLAHG